MTGMAVGRGYVVNGWDAIDPFHLLGAKSGEMLSAAQPAGAMPTATRSSLDANSDKPWHPDSPLFWFGALLAVTFGLIGASTTVRVGPFKAAAAAGNT